MSTVASTTPAPIILTSGEPAGIGPDLCILIAHHAVETLAQRPLLVLGDRNLLEQRANDLKLPVDIVPWLPGTPLQIAQQGQLQVWHQPLAQSVSPGQLDARNSRYVLSLLQLATEGCLRGEFAAMVTAPVHKGIINDAGIPFTGHTEWIAEFCACSEVVMMLVGGGMRVVIATRHMPLSAVPSAITRTGLASTLRILHADLQLKFGIANPRILVAGLNPHAGEDGYLGREEIEIINPTLQALRDEGLDLVGSLPADTMFSQSNIASCDAFVTMYHDQGLTVLKHASFGHGVNITLGLPIIRTSVDHGTALTLAGTGQADPSSLLTAITLAASLCSFNQ